MDECVEYFDNYLETEGVAGPGEEPEDMARKTLKIGIMVLVKDRYHALKYYKSAIEICLKNKLLYTEVFYAAFSDLDRLSGVQSIKTYLEELMTKELDDEVRSHVLYYIMGIYVKMMRGAKREKEGLNYIKELLLSLIDKNEQEQSIFFALKVINEIYEESGMIGELVELFKQIAEGMLKKNFNSINFHELVRIINFRGVTGVGDEKTFYISLYKQLVTEKIINIDTSPISSKLISLWTNTNSKALAFGFFKSTLSKLEIGKASCMDIAITLRSLFECEEGANQVSFSEFDNYLQVFKEKNKECDCKSRCELMIKELTRHSDIVKKFYKFVSFLKTNNYKFINQNEYGNFGPVSDQHDNIRDYTSHLWPEIEMNNGQVSLFNQVLEITKKMPNNCLGYRAVLDTKHAKHRIQNKLIDFYMELRTAIDYELQQTNSPILHKLLNSLFNVCKETKKGQETVMYLKDTINAQIAIDPNRREIEFLLDSMEEIGKICERDVFYFDFLNKLILEYYPTLTESLVIKYCLNKLFESYKSEFITSNRINEFYRKVLNFERIVSTVNVTKADNYFFMGHRLFTKRKFRMAGDFFIKAIDNYKEESELDDYFISLLHFYMGFVNLVEMKYQKAKQELEFALELQIEGKDLFKGIVDTYLFLCMIYMREGKYDRALTHLKDSASSFLFTDADIEKYKKYCIMAASFECEKKRNSAEEHYKLALEYFPANKHDFLKVLILDRLIVLSIQDENEKKTLELRKEKLGILKEIAPNTPHLVEVNIELGNMLRKDEQKRVFYLKKADRLLNQLKPSQQKEELEKKLKAVSK